jgi:hypothetical protein
MDLPTIKTHTNLAAFKVTSYIATCQVKKNKGICTMYTDNEFWFKATLTLPPQSAAKLLASPLIETDQSVILFTAFPCATGMISTLDLMALQEPCETPLSPLNNPMSGTKAHPVVPGGRPFTWIISTRVELNRSVADNKRRRVEKPTKHLLQELIELHESLNGQADCEDI